MFETDQVEAGQAGPDQAGEGGMSPEQAADFAAIMASSEEPEQQAQQQAQQQQDQALQAAVAENAMAIEVVWDIVGGMLPEKVAARYGREQRARIAESGTRLAIKRGWSMAEFMAKWGPEIAFGAALVGPVVPLVIEWAQSPKTKETPFPVLTPEAAPAPVTAPVPPAAAANDPAAKTVRFGAVAS